MSELATEKLMATVTWYRDTDAVASVPAGPNQLEIVGQEAGTEVLGGEAYPRSMPCVLEYVKGRAATFDGANRVKVAITVKKPADKDSPEQDMEFTIIEDTPDNVIKGIEQRLGAIKGPGYQLRMAVSKLMDMTDMTACLVTCVRSDGQVDGFSVLTESAPVHQEDTFLLADATINQVKAFKATMKSAFGLEFPGDSRIIIPGQR